jgi:hypothetical protein
LGSLHGGIRSAGQGLYLAHLAVITSKYRDLRLDLLSLDGQTGITRLTDCFTPLFSLHLISESELKKNVECHGQAGYTRVGNTDLIVLRCSDIWLHLMGELLRASFLLMDLAGIYSRTSVGQS